MNATATQPTVTLKSRDVMPRLGYKDRKSFWEAVYREGIPHTRISSRNIVFFEHQLNDWIAKRSTSMEAA